MVGAESIPCPGCGLEMPQSATATYDGYFNTSPECWSLFTEVLGTEFGNGVIFGQVHQLTADAYAVQHAGGSHPDKSIAVHLVGLHLALDRGVTSPRIPRLQQRLAASVEAWPHYPPPGGRVELTVLDVAMADTPSVHVRGVRAWAAAVWEAWAEHHAAVAELSNVHLGAEV